MITSTQATEILSTIARKRKKTFQLVDFEANEFGLMVQFRSGLKDPSKTGGYFVKFGLEVSPRMQEQDGVFTLWFREVAE